MSELSEEEIIKILQKIAEDEQEFYNTDSIIQRTAIQGLLDLYNKEKEEKQYEKELRLKYERRYTSRTEENKKLKEKNKELENADLTTVYMNGFYDGEKKWKEKLKELIKEIDNDNTDESWWYINKIQELLEKGDK